MPVKSILIIEDEPDIMEILQDVVADTFAGAAIETALDGKNALRLILAHRHDLIVTDMKMPGTSSHDLLGAISSLPASLAPRSVVVFSGHEDLDQLRKEVPGSLAVRFVAKPCPMPELARILREAAA